MKENYIVVENRNIGTNGNSVFSETVIYSGTKQECTMYENEKRREYFEKYGDNFGTFVDCWTEKETERQQKQNYYEALKEYVSTLTDEQKNEIVEVDGKKFYKYILDFKTMYSQKD